LITLLPNVGAGLVPALVADERPSTTTHKGYRLLDQLPKIGLSKAEGLTPKLPKSGLLHRVLSSYFGFLTG
jgi:hypothetical protein